MAIVLTSTLLGGCSSERTVSATTPPSTERLEPATTTVPVPSTATTPVPATPAACELLLPEEAALLAATPLDPPIQSDGMCTYTGPVTGPLAQVEIYVGPGALKILEIDRDELDHPFTEVAGIGDEATAEDGAIFVRVDATWLALRYVTLDEQSAVASRLEDAARTAAARL